MSRYLSPPTYLSSVYTTTILIGARQGAALSTPPVHRADHLFISAVPVKHYVPCGPTKCRLQLASPSIAQVATHCCWWVVVDVVDPTMPLWWNYGRVVGSLVCIDYPPLAVCKTEEARARLLRHYRCQTYFVQDCKASREVGHDSITANDTTPHAMKKRSMDAAVGTSLCQQ